MRGEGWEEQLARKKRRIAAVAFLSNISLDGSYRDTAWFSTYDRDCHTFGDSSANPHDDSLEEQLDSQNQDFTQRKRLNTGGSEGSCLRRQDYNYGAALGDSEVFTSHDSRHNHFSSNESFDHHSRGAAHLSTSNVSDSSRSSYLVPHGDLKTFNIREEGEEHIRIRNQRIVILVSKRTPCIVYSSIPYNGIRPLPPHLQLKDKPNEPRGTGNREKEEARRLRRARNTSGSRPISVDPDPLEQLVRHEEISYANLLQPSYFASRSKPFLPIGFGDESEFFNSAPFSKPPLSRSAFEGTTVNFKAGNQRDYPAVSRCVSYDANKTCANGSNNLVPIIVGEEEVVIEPREFISGGGYSPHLLDDPELRAGKHRTLMTFSSYLTSVIDYCKASDLKKELNDKFRGRFPHIQLTLSKLRSLKREMRRVVKTDSSVDLLTVAHAYVYFEKLILAAFVTKYNRKFSAGACLLLSAKLNDVKGENLHNLIEKIEGIFRVNRKELLLFEFAVLVALEFALHVPTVEVFPHYQRLLYES